jgi:hypothetical protein
MRPLSFNVLLAVRIQAISMSMRRPHAGLYVPLTKRSSAAWPGRTIAFLSSQTLDGKQRIRGSPQLLIVNKPSAEFEQFSSLEVSSSTMKVHRRLDNVCTRPTRYCNSRVLMHEQSTATACTCGRRLSGDEAGRANARDKH